MEVSHLILPAIIMLTALAIIMSGIAILFQIRRDRLPDATRYEQISELRRQLERVLAERKQELSIVEQKIQQRDRLIAEVSALEDRLVTLRAEYAALEEARSEIAEVKASAAVAAGDLAKVMQELKEKREEVQELSDSYSPQKMAFWKNEIDRLKEEHQGISKQLNGIQAERDSALRTIEEGKAAFAQTAVRVSELEQLRRTAGILRGEIEELQRKREDLKNERNEVDRLKAVREALQARIAHLEVQFDELERERKEHGQTAHPESPVDEERLLEDLLKLPTSLEFPALTQRYEMDEDDALQTVTTYLKDHRLKFSRQTVCAFHTALKINDFSQLTVLAGVSGTGKSLLPRRYAEAMGMHFLQIAVEPRWDSPQDLLGFYNYIEKSYRATDLARLLVHMDRYCYFSEPNVDYHDHVALVLLDEMNLARVEYYFSEFLSRLEARPRYDEAHDDAKRLGAEIPIDIRGLTEPLTLFPSHNVLFAGTMNDDESTQSLSDKVLDRSNILQFAAPHEFPQLKKAETVERPREALPMSSWRGWIRSVADMEGTNRGRADDVIKRLSEIMELCGRPFGHRLRDSMLAYVANYPKFGSSDFHVPLADQIELRILPKLRGIEIDSHRDAFDGLDRLIRDDLNDHGMADRITELCDRQASRSGLFVWRGLTREG